MTAASVRVSLEGFHAVKHALRFAPEHVETVHVRDEQAARRLAERLAPDVLDALLARASVREVAHHPGSRPWRAGRRRTARR